MLLHDADMVIDCIVLHSIDINVGLHSMALDRHVLDPNCTHNVGTIQRSVHYSCQFLEEK